MSWTCKCCTVIFAERADFDRHKTDCINRGTACAKCNDVFISAGLKVHLENSICGLRQYNIKDLYSWAKEVNEQRIHLLVKEYHWNIMNAVAKGRFGIRLHFIYADSDPVVRQGILAKVIENLQTLFAHVEIKADDKGKCINVAWDNDACDRVCLSHSVEPEKNVIVPKDDSEWVRFWKDIVDEATPEKRDEPLSPIGLKKDIKGQMRKIMSSYSKPKKLTRLIPELDDTPVQMKFGKRGLSEETRRSIWEKHIGSNLPTSDDEQEHEQE
jgi:hypothetical protein